MPAGGSVTGQHEQHLPNASVAVRRAITLTPFGPETRIPARKSGAGIQISGSFVGRCNRKKSPSDVGTSRSRHLLLLVEIWGSGEGRERCPDQVAGV